VGELMTMLTTVSSEPSGPPVEALVCKFSGIQLTFVYKLTPESSIVSEV
jgi:hypothetical protein